MNAESAYARLSQELTSHRHSFNEVQRLHDKELVTRRLRRVVAEASFLGAYSAFEAFLEELLFAVLMGESGLPDSSKPVQFRDRVAAEKIITLNAPFLKYLPWKEGIAKASEKLIDSRGPFGRLDRSVTELRLLEDARRLRNAVAHRSPSAVSGAKPLLDQMPPGKRNVAEFLCRTTAGVTAFDSHLSNFRAVAACLSSTDVAAGHRLLLDERPYDQNDIAPRGSYQCVRMSHKRTISRVAEELGPCAKCKHGRSQWHRLW